MVTVLDKELRRQITVDGADYTVVVDPDRLRLVGKGKRKPEVELRWRDLLSGDAAMAVALNASLQQKNPASAVAGKTRSGEAGKASAKAPRKPRR